MKAKESNINSENINIDISEIATKTEYNFHNLNIPFINTNEIFPIGLDVGYSSTKVYSMYGYHKFPSLVKSLRDWEVKNYIFKKDTFIMYRDEDTTKKHWLVGDLVAETGSDKATTDEDMVLSTNRVGSFENLVLNRVGIALGLLTPELTIKKNPEINIAIGLPEKFMDFEQPYTDQLKGYHKFEIQIGTSDWIPVAFTIEEDRIDVLSQPYGTLLSVAANRQGRITDQTLLEASTALVYDAGYGTVDPFVIKNGSISDEDSTTWMDMAMKEIHLKLLYIGKEITGRTLSFRQINHLLSLPEDKRYVQHHLGKKWYFDSDLKNCINEVANDNIRELKQKYREFNDIDVIIMTGGTSKVFYPYFSTLIPNIKIKIAEVNDAKKPEDNFDCVFANTVGFFNYVVMKLRIASNYTDEIKTSKFEEAVVTGNKSETAE